MDDRQPSSVRDLERDFEKFQREEFAPVKFRIDFMWRVFWAVFTPLLAGIAAGVATILIRGVKVVP